MISGGECKNCGATLAGRYCSACGQVGDVRIPSFGRLAWEFLEDLFSFDSRVWRSLAALVRPGRLTNRFLEGQRARYSPPFRLYVVTSLVFFAILSLGGGGDAATPPQDGAPGADTAAAARPSNAEDEELGIAVEDDGWECGLDKGIPPQLRARLEAACAKIEADSGASFGRAFADNVPVMMFVFIPLIAALMKLLYAFAGRKYVEHLLFLVHFHTFFFFTAIITILLERSANLVPFLELPVGIAIFAAWIYFPVYLYLALRHVYRQGRALTAVKYVALGGGYTVAFLATMLGLMLYTAITL